MDRDMLSRKFESCASAQHFDPVPEIEPVTSRVIFKGADGLRVVAVLRGEPWSGAVRVNRRATLTRLVAARRAYPRRCGVVHTNTRPFEGPNEEAPGAVTPGASD